MKNAATPPQASDGRPSRWRDALRPFDRDLQRRGAAERTRRAYGTDVGRARAWAAAQGLEPDRRRLPGRCAATPPSCPSAAPRPRTLARKLAVDARVLPHRWSSTASMAANPADLLPAPKLPAAAAAHAQAATTSPRCSTASRPRRRSSCATARCSSSPTRCGLRAEELVDLDARVDRLRRRAGARRGQGRQDPLRARRASPRCASSRATWSAAGPRCEAPTASPRCSSPRPAGGSPPPTSGAACGSGRATPRRRARCIRTPSGTPSRPTCWRAARTCARSRSCSATRRISTTQVYTRVESARLRAAYAAQPPAGLGGADSGDQRQSDRAARTSGAATRPTGSDRAREQLVVAYSPLVKYVAGRMSSGLPAHVEEADLISYGLIGLINAIERFDLEREIKFETYAITRIKGAIIDELRALDWVPRSVRARAREIERVHGKLEHRLHRTPTDEEMAARAGASRSRSSRRRWSRSPTPRSSRSTSCGRCRTPPATRSRCSTRCTTPTRRTRSSCSTPPSSRTAWPTRSPRCPSARSS